MEKSETYYNVPIWEKATLSFKEAAAYTGIGEQKLRFLVEQVPDLGIRIGTSTRVKREPLVKYLYQHNDL